MRTTTHMLQASAGTIITWCKPISSLSVLFAHLPDGAQAEQTMNALTSQN